MIHDPLNIFTADFGERFILHTSAGDRDVMAIYEDPRFSAELGQTYLDTSKETITVKECDVCDLRREDYVTRVSTNLKYQVIEKHPDGTGFVTVMLSA